MHKPENRSRRLILVIASLLAGQSDDEQMTRPGFHRALQIAGIAASLESLDRELADMVADGLLRSMWPDPEDLMRYRITRSGHEAIASTAGSSAEASEHEQEPTTEIHLRADHAGVCMTTSELDAWWESLTIDQKAEALMNHYSGLAADNERVAIAGKAALEIDRG